MNALAHGADSLYTPFANPVSRDDRPARRRADRHRARRRARPSATAPPWPSARSSAATRSTPACFALHHVICQTLVRVCGSPHARPTPRSCPGRWPSWPRAPRSRSPPWRRRSAPSRSESKPASSSSAATRPAWASRRGPRASSTRPSESMLAAAGARLHAGAADPRRAVDRLELIERPRLVLASTRQPLVTGAGAVPTLV